MTALQKFAIHTAALFTCSANVSFAEEPINYNRDIRPILAKNCFACHGPDEQSREAGLRLDEQASATAQLDSGTRAIVPWEVGESEVVARINSHDPDLLMPPPESHQKLTRNQKKLLANWIQQGAAYQKHWSMIRPQRVEPPDVNAPSEGFRIANAVDAFVLSRLAQEGLQPAPPAGKRALIRRLSLDLTGLPPTLPEIDEFLADDRPDAYERLVDRLLASPHYGERMALVWLDAARYADTHGYHIDSHREMWPWRDWVIQAYNKNLKFDDFTTWQLAGDLLPEPTKDQLIASGFNRNHGINFEGGAIPEEYHVEYVVDRVNTTGVVWMGLTLGCARCHDHKYDPISQEEYFRLFAFFNTIDEKGLDGQRGNATPLLQLPNDEQKTQQIQLSQTIKRLENELKPWEERLDLAQQKWEMAAPSTVGEDLRPALKDSQWYTLPPIVEETAAEVLNSSYLTPKDKIDLSKPVSVREEEKTWTAAASLTDGHAHSFPFERSATYLHRTITVKEARSALISVGCTDAIQLWLNGRQLIDRRRSLPVPQRQREFEVELLPGENHLLAKVVNISWECEFYFALRTKDDRIPPAIHKILRTAREERSESDVNKLKDYYRENIFPEKDYQDLRSRLLAARRQLEVLNQEITTTMVMRELQRPRKTFRLERGQYDSPQEEVSPATPTVLPALPESGAKDRLALARWLTSPKHPLTARVTVNRMWQMLFGDGLVSTSGDFGTQGAWPSHPELLDWLAVEFVESGWDVKHMLRLMVLSSTYRQSSASTVHKNEQDPDNRLLSRGPRFRLQAELIRDLALHASGLLNEKIGGPSEKNYQPAGLWLELAHQKDNSKFTAQQFQQASGEALYRRGLYTFWKRSVPPPNLVALDAPNRETCVVQREITNTPLQALVLLNDPTFVETARGLAERMMKETSDVVEERAKLGFLLATSREPTDRELQIIADRYEWHLAEFQDDTAAAEKLLQVGDSPRDGELDLAEHAAWTCIASMLLNLDETMTKE